MENKILATVNGTEIRESDIQTTINKFPQDKQTQFNTENGKKQLLNEMIFFELVYNYAKDINLEKDKEYLQNLEIAKKEILTQTAIAKAMDEVDVTDKEVKDYYEVNKNMYREPEMIKAKHILVDGLEKAKEVSKLISEGMDFGKAAAEYSSCPSKSKGGDLGKFSKGQTVPEFEEAAFNLDIGVISEPVKTKFGYHIIKVEEKIESRIKAFDEVKDDIKRGLLQERQAYRYSKLNSELRNKYEVVIK